MLITIPFTASSQLSTILTDAKKKILSDNIKSQEEYNLLIQNLWTQDIYLEIWSPAVVLESVKITTWQIVVLEIDNLSLINLISAVADNTNVRLIWAGWSIELIK